MRYLAPLLFLLGGAVIGSVAAQTAAPGKAVSPGDVFSTPPPRPAAGATGSAPAGVFAPTPKGKLSTGDEAFLKDMEAQRKALEAKGAAAVELPAKPPAPTKPAAAPKGRNAPPEPPPTIDADLAAIAETEGMIEDPDAEEAEARAQTKTVVFISLSMPERDLKALFEQGRGRPDVMFVLRGWKPPNFTALGQKVKTLMYEAGGFDINVVIDPYPFRTYRVKQVPMFLHERSGGDWRRVTGAVALDRAIDEIERGNYNKVLGATYRVAEPDIVEEMQKLAEAFDWEKEKKRIEQKALTNLDGGRPLLDLPRVETSREFYLDPSIVLMEDVVAPDGTIAARKGDAINPFASMAFSKRFIAFNPDDPKQIAVAKRWMQEHAPVMLLATHLPTPQKGKPTLAQTMGQSVYPLNPELIERMGIAAVPSLIQQHGLLLRINEEKP